MEIDAFRIVSSVLGKAMCTKIIDRYFCFNGLEFNLYSFVRPFHRYFRWLARKALLYLFYVFWPILLVSALKALHLPYIESIWITLPLPLIYDDVSHFIHSNYNKICYNEPYLSAAWFASLLCLLIEENATNAYACVCVPFPFLCPSRTVYRKSILLFIRFI